MKLNEEIEKLKLKTNDVTVAKLDIEAMYLSIQFSLVKKAVRYFSKDLSEEDKKKIDKFLEMIGFGMKNTLVTSIDKYYEYGGDID